MIRSPEELIEDIRAQIGEDTSDEALALMENVTDTVNSLTSKTGEDWEQKYKDNDAAWRKRYRDRFSGAVKQEDDEDFVPDESTLNKPKRFEDLFTFV